MAWQYRTGMSKDPRANIQNQGIRTIQGMQRAQGDYEGALGSQQDALGLYRDAAMGQGPSAAGSMLQQGSEQAMANAQALASQGRNGNLQASNQAAVTAGLAASNQASHAAAQQAAMEQQAAMQGYAGLGSTMAGQAMQQQNMYGQQMQGQLGLQVSDDQHRRMMDLEGRKYRTDRNMGWAGFGTNVAGSVLEGIFGGGA